jgi:hypothetical protein
MKKITHQPLGIDPNERMYIVRNSRILRILPTPNAVLISRQGI